MGTVGGRRRKKQPIGEFEIECKYISFYDFVEFSDNNHPGWKMLSVNMQRMTIPPSSQLKYRSV